MASISAGCSSLDRSLCGMEPERMLADLTEGQGQLNVHRQPAEIFLTVPIPRERLGEGQTA